MVGGLPGVRRQGEQDFPLPLQESVTPLPFHAGGSFTLVANEIRDLVRVSDLRRFENMGAVARGAHDGAANAAELADSSADFRAWGIEVGDELSNTTSGVSGVITFVIPTSLTADGVTWDVGDAYVVNKQTTYLSARAIEIRKFSITADRPIYVRYDGAPDATDGYDVEIEAGETYYEEHIRIASRLVARAVTGTDTPKVRFTAWGI